MVQKKQLKKCIVERIKIKKSDLKCFLQKRALSHCIYGEKKKSALALYFRNTKSEYRCLFAKNAIEVQDGSAKNEPGMRRVRLPTP